MSEQTYIGKTYVDDRNTEDSTQSDAQNEVRHTELPEDARVVPSDGGFLSMDFKPDRLNLYLDENKVVTKVTKG